MATKSKPAKAAAKADAKAAEEIYTPPPPPVTPPAGPKVVAEKLGPHDVEGDKIVAGDVVSLTGKVHGVDDYSEDQNSIVTIQVEIPGDEKKFIDIAVPAKCLTLPHKTKK
jgi:hypothetical protein